MVKSNASSVHDFGAMSALADLEEGYLKQAPLSALLSAQKDYGAP
jgi:hypothetical protein